MFPLWWQLFSQHKHWHGDSHLLLGRFLLFSLLARLISLGFHHRASAESASKLWKWLLWQAPGILSIWGWWVHLMYCGPVQKSSFHSSTPELAVAAPGYEYPAPPTSFPIYTWLSSLSLLTLSLALHSSTQVSFYSLFLYSPPSIWLSSAPSSALCYSLSPCLSPVQSALLGLLGWFRPLQRQPQSWYHLSTFTLYSLSLLLYPYICQLFLLFVSLFLSSTPLNASVFTQWLHFFSVHQCPSVSPACFPSVLLSQTSDKARA